MEFEVPDAVVTVTGTLRGVPFSVGTVTVHEVSAEQLVGAAIPSTYAWTCPSGLNRLTPDSVKTCPAAPPTGVSEVSSGAPPAGCGGAVAFGAVAGLDVWAVPRGEEAVPRGEGEAPEAGVDRA